MTSDDACKTRGVPNGISVERRGRGTGSVRNHDGDRPTRHGVMAGGAGGPACGNVAGERECPRRVVVARRSVTPPRLKHGGGSSERESRSSALSSSPDSRSSALSGSPNSRSSSLAEPSGSLAEPSGSLAEPSGSLAEPSGSLAEPSDSLAEPSDSLEPAPALARRYSRSRRTNWSRRPVVTSRLL